MLSHTRTSERTKKLVSVIIPASQAEEFIERSVQSALNQTYKNLEVIAIENGSKDKTLEILKKIKNDKLIVLQSEKGVSNARNKGINNAQGEYVLFLDADDWLEPNSVETMMDVIEDEVDVVSARYCDDRQLETYECKRYEAGSEEYIVKCLCAPTKRGNCTGNLYRTKFIKDHDIQFDSSLSHAEDTVFFTELLIMNPTVVDIEKPVYHVYINPKSVTREGKNNVDDFCNATKRIYALLEESSDDIKNAGYICALNQVLVILVNNKKNILELVRYMRDLFQREVFKEAIERSDISQINGIIKYVFELIKMKRYLLLALIVKARADLNSYRRRNQK